MTDLLVAGVIWTACAVVAWFIANAKHAPDAGSWAFWGLLLGPFGVLGAIAFAKPGGPPRSGRSCGRCGKPLSPAWKAKCNHCGASFAEYPPNGKEAPVPGGRTGAVDG